MLSRMKDAALNATSKFAQKDALKENSGSGSANGKQKKPEKYAYARPYFLGLDKDEVQHSQDFGMRPILKPRNIHDMPLIAGYAECINGGKSDNNEDNSYACDMCIRSTPPIQIQDQLYDLSVSNTLATGRTSNSHLSNTSGRSRSLSDSDTSGKALRNLQWEKPRLEAVYFGLFDGHAGYHSSLISSRTLHTHIQDQISLSLDVIIQKMRGDCGLQETSPEPFDELSDISVDELVIGAIEQAFQLMDDQLKADNVAYNVLGGCTALVSLFFNNKLYVANAGDCRAVLCHGDKVDAVSRDFTPESERTRLYALGSSNPDYLRDEFSCIEFPRRVNRTDIGTQMLCRRPGYHGWSYKTIDEEDLKFPLVCGSGKNARIMGTIGVSRGLGDHNLFVYDSDIWIKPFLSCMPEVQVIDLSKESFTDTDVLIMASDGLWDVVSNSAACRLVRQALSTTKPEDKNRYIIAAYELVADARGKFTGRGWRKNDDVPSSFDDISAFVIPIHVYIEKMKKTKLFTNTITDDPFRA